MGLLVVAALHGLPDLFLPGMVVGNREGHQLLQRHAVIGVDFQQPARHAGELQPLPDDLQRHEEAGGDLFLAEALLLERLERAELIQRMERYALAVFGQRILFQNAVLPHDAGDRRVLRQPLLLDQ